MTIVVLFLKSYWKQIAGALALAFVLYTGYSFVYDRGYADANVEAQKRFDDYTKKIGDRIEKIEGNSSQLLSAAAEADKARQKSFNDILFTIKGKPLYTIQQGKCTPSDDFVKAYNEGIKKANGQ